MEETKMKLMTKAIEARFAKLGRQEGKGDQAIVVAKFFCPWNGWTWFATEFEADEPGTEDGNFFGLVVGHETELGYFNRKELENVRGLFGLGIERDLHWTERTLAEVREKAGVL
jgi:hypothetical protein